MIARAAAILLALALLQGQAPPDDPAPPPGPAEIAARTAAYEKVSLRSDAADGAEIVAYLRRPAGDRPAPVVVALHGCGGLLGRRGAIAAREADWAARWYAAGFAVLFVDSFNPRGFREICTVGPSERRVRPGDRARDAAAAIAWIATRPDLDKARVALVGWSHGAMSTLWAVGGRAAATVDIRAAVAFYPGCRDVLRSDSWSPRAPLTLLLAEKDDWTDPEPCRRLAERAGARAIVYPGAYHGFDAPASPVRQRTGLGGPKSGTAHVGTDPAARAAAITEVTRILAEAFR